MALSPKEKKELQQRFEKQLLPDLDLSFELMAKYINLILIKISQVTISTVLHKQYGEVIRMPRNGKNMVNIRR